MAIRCLPQFFTLLQPLGVGCHGHCLEAGAGAPPAAGAACLCAGEQPIEAGAPAPPLARRAPAWPGGAPIVEGLVAKNYIFL